MPLDQHDHDEEGFHRPDECERRIERDASVVSACCCGNCCESLLIEASLRDAEREPQIAAKCRPLKEIGPEIVGYLLNDRNNDMACHFFDRQMRLCTIYKTRPLICRLFNCDTEGARVCLSAASGELRVGKRESPMFAH